MATDRRPEARIQMEVQTMGESLTNVQETSTWATSDKDDLRIVLFGRNDPKSQLINIIKDPDAGKFKEDPPPEDGTQQEYQCQKYSRSINDKNVVIIDAPGVDTAGDEENLLEEIKWSVAAADPGPHVFLFVERINETLGDDELEALKDFHMNLDKKFKALYDFQMIFGKQANDFTVTVFITDGKNNIKPFRNLTYPFNHRYFIFNTKDDKQRQETKVTELLEKIAEMRGEASACFYTPKMLWDAEKAFYQEEQKFSMKKWNILIDQLKLLCVIAAQVGATIGFLVSVYLNLDSASAGGVGSIVGVIFAGFPVFFLVYYKCIKILVDRDKRKGLMASHCPKPQHQQINRGPHQENHTRRTPLISSVDT